MRIPTLFLAALSIACAEPPVPEVPDPPTATDLPMTARSTPDHTLRLAEPLTLRLEPGGDLLTALETLGDPEAEPTTLRLTLKDLVGPDTPVTVRVFVNTADANATTSIDEPGYVSDVGFFPVGGQGEAAANTFLLDLGRVLGKLPDERRLIENRFVDVTLIALPLGDEAGTETLEAVELSLRRIVLSAQPPE